MLENELQGDELLLTPQIRRTCDTDYDVRALVSVWAKRYWTK